MVNKRRMMKVVEGHSISWDLLEFMDEVEEVYQEALCKLRTELPYLIEWAQSPLVVVPNTACYLDEDIYSELYI